MNIPIHVLIVDDSNDDREMYATFLGQKGLSCDRGERWRGGRAEGE